MQSSRFRDLVVGLFVLAGLAAIAYLSLQVGGLSYKGPGGLELVASFDAVGGLSERAPVRIAGVKVGQVESIALGDDLRARVTLDLDPRLALSTDTVASIRAGGHPGEVKVLTSCPSCLQGLSRYRDDTGVEADYIVVEIARRLLGESWMADYVAKVNSGGIERVLL